MSKYLITSVSFAALALAGCSFELTSSDPAQAGPRAACGPEDMVCTGQILAEARCARCHAVWASGNSPYPGAQPFRVFWQRWTKPALAGALRTGIIVQHDNSGVKLPEMKLEDAEIKVLFAYLDTIQEK